jgi:hypothetical protein
VKKISLIFFVVGLHTIRFFQFVTEGERPEGTPRNIRMSALSPTELELMWDEPDTELSHGTILRYNIGIREFR